jgi:hypothetical protein
MTVAKPKIFSSDDLGQKVEIWETIERKWMEALFFHKQ